MAVIPPGDVEGDDPAIPDEDSVLRRLSDSGPNMVTIDLATGVCRPTSGAFRCKPDEDGVSVYRESVLAAAGLTAAALVKAPQNLVLSLGIAEVRSRAHLGVGNDPWPQDVDEPDHPRNAAHALIVGWTGLTKSQRRERQVALATLPSLRFIYP